MTRSALILSIDFEQNWGLYDLGPKEINQRRMAGGRRAIFSLLDLFKQFQIHATWATVGLLMCEGKKDALARFATSPMKSSLGRRLLKEVKSSGNSEAEDPAHYCPSLVRQIARTPHQEIASHTFGHYCCLDRGSTLDDLKTDLCLAQAIAGDNELQLDSIVFPRDQYNAEHLAIAKDRGFLAFRGTPPNSLYAARTKHTTRPQFRLLRLLDAHLPIVKSSQLLGLQLDSQGLVNVPATRFLRSVGKWDGHFAVLRLRRVLSEMTLAATLGRNYHLWWHPYNFGMKLKENLDFLATVFEHFRLLQGTHQMQTLTIREAASLPGAGMRLRDQTEKNQSTKL